MINQILLMSVLWLCVFSNSFAQSGEDLIYEKAMQIVKGNRVMVEPKSNIVNEVWSKNALEQDSNKGLPLASSVTRIEPDNTMNSMQDNEMRIREFGSTPFDIGNSRRQSQILSKRLSEAFKKSK